MITHSKNSFVLLIDWLVIFELLRIASSIETQSVNENETQSVNENETDELFPLRNFDHKRTFRVPPLTTVGPLLSRNGLVQVKK